MIDPTSDSSQLTKNWDAYWHGTGDIGAYSSGGVSHPAIKSFWTDFFAGVKQDLSAPVMLDIASGNGAIVESALQTFDSEEIDISCVDVSDSAIKNIQNRFADVHGVLADARDIPSKSERFDVVTSQFGVEYAGLEAIDEAVRLLAPGGRLALLLHNETGSIHQECATSLDAISRVQESAFVSFASEMFRSGFAAVRGADRAPYEAAARQFAPAIATLEDIMREHGTHVAGDTIVRLYNDVAGIHSDIQQYDPDEVLNWLGRMNDELETYSGRMSSMCDAAIDRETFERICSNLSDRHCTIQQAGPLSAPGEDLPLAWVLRATK